MDTGRNAQGRVIQDMAMAADAQDPTEPSTAAKAVMKIRIHSVIVPDSTWEGVKRGAGLSEYLATRSTTSHMQEYRVVLRHAGNIFFLACL